MAYGMPLHQMPFPYFYPSKLSPGMPSGSTPSFPMKPLVNSLNPYQKLLTPLNFSKRTDGSMNDDDIETKDSSSPPTQSGSHQEDDDKDQQDNADVEENVEIE